VATHGLQLAEHAHVLDRDGGLVGGGLEQRDLRVRKRPRLELHDRDGADGHVVVQHGDNEDAAIAGRSLRLRDRVRPPRLLRLVDFHEIRKARFEENVVLRGVVGFGGTINREVSPRCVCQTGLTDSDVVANTRGPRDC
jgi:hypothetical protein